ncbi:MAG TPA: tetratricopeptide repeat protein, partial [Gemmatimonadaceae bacterium]|nr:tetratricopeptide repeat protein [Gemmatimonadaceae bacterium]
MADLLTWRAKRAALAALLEEPDASSRRDELKAEIIALYKAVDQGITDLTALRDEIKTLVEKWKALQGPSIAPQFVAERPVLHQDHIGASTFIEKGWSRLSLGDHEGAEAALRRAIELAPGDPQSEALLGWAQMLQEKYDEALENFQRVLVREPQNSLARINVGYISLKKGTFSAAIEHLSK